MSDASLLDEIIKSLEGLSEAQLADAAKEAMKGTPGMLWVPNPGPQEQAYDCDADELYFGGEVGGGKALEVNSDVLTPHGWTKIGSLKVGSKICAVDGTVTEVIGVFPQGVLPLYRFTFSDGGTVCASADHNWLGWWSGESRKIANIPTSGEAAAQKYTTKEIMDRMEAVKSNKKGTRFTIPVCAPVAFNVPGCPRRGPDGGFYLTRAVDPYLLGLILGDGCITNEKIISIASADEEIENYLVETYGDDVSKDVSGSRCDTYRFVGETREFLAEQLGQSRLGLSGHGAGSKFIPQVYLFGSVNERWALLQGLMDTDGWADKDGDTYYSTISKQLADDVTHLARSLGAIVTRTEKYPTYTYNGERRDGQLAYTLRIKMPQPDRMFRLTRKREVCADKVHQSMGRYLERLEYSHDAECVCIAVRHASSLYITEDFIVTHNSDLIIGLALNKHHSSLLLRRINDDARGLADRMADVLGHANGLNRTLLEWRLPDGRKIDFGGCQLEDDKQRYKGKPHDLICVGRGTPVLMGDGSWTPVENLLPGQLVQTLEGPRRIQKIYPNQRKKCVEVTARDWDGTILARQFQSTAHSLFSGSDWICSGDRADVYGPNLYRDNDKPSQWCWEKYGSPLMPLSETWPGPARMVGFFRRFAQNLFGSASPFSGLLSILGTYSVSCNGSSPSTLRLPLLFSQLRRSQPFPYSASPASSHYSGECGVTDGRSSSLFSNLMGRCLSYIRRYGGHTPKSSGSSTALGRDLKCLLLQVGAARPTPSHSPNHDAAQTQTHTRLLGTYAHPYTKEIRPISLSCSAQYAALEVSLVGEMEVYDLQIEEVRHYITSGGFVNKNCFDEGADFTESQFEFIKIWNRSADPNQKCRVVVASNPPTTAAGLWITKRWAAWLDKRHPNPAKSGEIRWYIRNEDGVEIEVDGVGPHPVRGEMVKATSRTFIRSRLEDNPNYIRSGYKDRLHLLPEELQKAYRGGDYEVGLRDQPNQLIPAAWIEAAQKRWTPMPPQGYPMTTIGVDCSGGGTDPMIIAQRYDTWFAPLVEIPGKDIPMDAMGKFAMAHIVSRRKDLATIVLDMGGGYGQAIFENLKENRIEVIPYKGAEATNARTADRQHGFYNYRSYAWWKFREALDPDQEQGSPIALPPDTALMADLSTPTFQIEARGVKIETKEAINKRLGRSTDRGDAVVMAWIGSLSSAYGGSIKRRDAQVSVVTKRDTRAPGVVIKRRRR